MSGPVLQEAVTVLVKALPRPSRNHTETVCCAGITDDGQWKRLFPVRYRHGGEDFRRWDRISFDYRPSERDRRSESCRVIERTIRVTGRTEGAARRDLIEPLITGSAAEAASLGRSLTAIRPRDIHFVARPKSTEAILEERLAYAESARQEDFLDEHVTAFEPSPFAFRMRFRDEAGQHDCECGDWETQTAFWRRRQMMGDRDAIESLRQTYEKDFARRGLIFVLGNMAARPRTWLLLGIVRLDDTPWQPGLF